MAERRVAEIVDQRQRLGEILVEPQRAGQRAGDLRHLDRVGQPRAVVVALVRDEDLRLVLEAAEGGGMDDAVAVALERRARRALRLRRSRRPRGLRGIAGIGARAADSRSRCRRSLPPFHAPAMPQLDQPAPVDLPLDASYLWWERERKVTPHGRRRQDHHERST